MPKIKDSTDKWRVELKLAEKFRDEVFGKYDRESITKAGENIDYFERGFSFGHFNEDDDTSTTLNIFHALVKNVVPTLYYKNPVVTVRPKRKVDETTAPIVSEIINYYYKELDIDSENRKVIWDAYVLGKGYYKIGYASKFGADVEPEEKKKKKSPVDRGLEALGLKTPEKEEVIHPEINQKIVAENPFVLHVSPFNVLVDPRATSLENAQWVAHEVEKTVAEIKRNPKYKNTKNLVGSSPELPQRFFRNMPQSDFDEFRTVKLYEIEYRRRDGMYTLIITKDGGNSDELTEHYHEKSIYEMDGFQIEELDFGQHEHSYYKRSELTKIKNLQDRFTATIDNILEQVDQFVSKIGVDTTSMSQESLNLFKNGGLGAVVEFNKNPAECVREISLTQFKGDLAAFNDQLINLVTIQTGITRAQLTGLSQSETATEATIQQSGQTVRLAELSQSIDKFSSVQAKKLWQVIRQFIDLEELEVVTGESGIDEATGLVKFNWLPGISSEDSMKMAVGSYRFDISIGSSQKIDNALITKRIENLISILGRTDVIALMQQQGKKVDLAEILRLWLQANPEIVKDTTRIIQDVTQGTQGLLPAQEILIGGGQGGFTNGSANNQLQALRGESVSPAQQGAQI